MLSAQIAHVQLLGLESLTDRVGGWSGEHLSAQVLAWARHVELAWATLTADEQQRTLAHARHLLDANNESRGLLASSWMEKELETGLAPPRCHSTIVANVIANRHSPPALRAAAIRHHCECGGSDTQSVGTLVSERLQGARLCSGLDALAGVLADSLTADAGGSAADAPAVLASADAALAQHHIHALGPAIADAVTRGGDSARLVRQLLEAPAARDGVLTAGVISSAARAAVEPELVAALAGGGELLALDLDGHAAAWLCGHSAAVAGAYAECLARATRSCQRRSLQDAARPAGAGDWEPRLGAIAERWQLLALRRPAAVPSALAPCRAPLTAAIAELRPPLTSHVFDAVVEFWRALYAQFLGPSAAALPPGPR